MERMIREKILQVHSDVQEPLHLRVPATVLDNPVLTLYPFDHLAMKHGWLRQVTLGTLELLRQIESIHRIHMKAAGLLSEFLGTLGSDFQQLPICAKSWKTMSKASKEHAYDQVKENLKRKPAGIEANHWKKFLQYRLDDDTKDKCRKNAVNRSKQQYTHTGGSKTMARKRHEEEQRLGMPIGRGEGWTMSHKKRNGKYMNEQARLVGEAIELVESQDPSSKEFSQNDSLAQVLGKEHPGRVRGLGIGTCPSRCFRNIPEQSDYGVQIEEYQMEIVKLKAEAAELRAAAAAAEAKRQRMETEAAEGKAKIQTMGDLLTYVIQQQGGNLPPEIAAGLDYLRSAPTSSHAR
ncbi:uncharacterized protein LOC107477763 [Arachis duranensis]|uniref:Uncharacterized protein LOC107477763 n=1 Tax=Arachis duranensis TaxID=130453 RepID=A0A6P4CLZ6_ARADU|nr:uncharacterized protein LOC107477763 [Arachis duranensis]